MRTLAEFRIQHLQLLDAQGALVGELRAFAHDNDELLKMFAAMLRARVFDAKAVNLQRTGKPGTCAPCLGGARCSSKARAKARAKNWIRATPIRALAKRLGVQLAACKATGRHALVGVDDVLAVANIGPARSRAATPGVPSLTDADRLRCARNAMSSQA